MENLIKPKQYTYIDFVTKKNRFTRGEFVGWTHTTGPLNVRYAVFRRTKSELIIPEYLLTLETKQLIERK